MKSIFSFYFYFYQVWMSRLLSSQFAKDHRTGEAMCKCIHSFIEARSLVIPPAPLVKPKIVRNDPESMEDYGDFAFDFEDPTIQQLLGEVDASVDQYRIHDQKASEVRVLSLQSSWRLIEY